MQQHLMRKLIAAPPGLTAHENKIREVAFRWLRFRLAEFLC